MEGLNSESKLLDEIFLFWPIVVLNFSDRLYGSLRFWEEFNSGSDTISLTRIDNPSFLIKIYWT